MKARLLALMRSVADSHNLFGCTFQDQFEPDHPNYIETAQYVYDFIDTMGHYEVLHSTRHYGPMVFYLVWERKADNLIIHYLKKLQLAEACKVRKT